MNASQTRAVEQFRQFMRTQLDRNPERCDTVVEFEVDVSNYGSLWVKAKTDMVGLGENNLLRAVSKQWWLVLVGKHGALTVRQAPSAFHQFHGRRAYSMNFNVK